MKAEKRTAWIDIMRGILMITIVWGHVYNTGILRQYLYSFHVPAFFFLSGFCFTYRHNFRSFFYKRLRTIIIPYFFFSVVSIVIFFICSRFVGSLSQLLECDPATNLIVMLYGNSKPEVMRYNLPLWFLPCLFLTSCIGYCEEAIVSLKGKPMRIVAIFIFALIGAFFSKHEDIALPWHFETSISMAVWFVLGISCREFTNRKNGLRIIQRIWPLSICVGIVCCTLNTRTVGVRNEHYGILVFYYLAAFSTILGIMGFSIFIGKNCILEYIGRNSIAILGIHKFPIIIFQEIIPFTKNILEKPNTFIAIVVGGGVCFIAIGISLIGNIVLKKIMPWTIGINRFSNAR